MFIDIFMFPLPRNQVQELPHSDQKPLHLVVLLRIMSKLHIRGDSRDTSSAMSYVSITII